MPSKAIPSAERTKWFVESRFGMFIHWGLYALTDRFTMLGSVPTDS